MFTRTLYFTVCEALGKKLCKLI